MTLRDGIEEKIEEFQKRIIQWYEEHGERSLPWRSARDPWAALVAGFLLRKTTVKQVAKVYNLLISRFPSPEAMAGASEEEVKRIIKPLGIEHQRARHFIELAQAVRDRFGGRVPRTREELKKLPGVGDYIASEVLLLAFNQPEPLLDRNMIRVIERVFGVKSAKKRPHTDPEIWRFAKRLVPPSPDKAKAFNYGVLDFARKVCTAGRPKCSGCAIKDLCSAPAHFGQLKSA